ncbi:YfhO family protein [Bacteroidota bacterium]
MAKKAIKKPQKAVAPTHKVTAKDKKQPEIKNFSLWIVAVIFIITTTLFFWDQFAGNSFFWEDFVEQVYPIQTFAAQAFSNGEIPFWNPYTFCGMPFLADLQVGFFYPLNRLTALFIDSSGHLSVWGLQFIITLHFFIAHLCMYFLMRYLKVSSIGSILASISFAFSFAMVLHVIHPMMVYHLAWFPLVFMFFIRGISEFKIKYGIIAGLIFGLSMLAGHPQTILYEVLFLGLFLVWYLIAGFRKGDLKANKIIKFLVAGIVPFIISVGIFSVQYLPSQDLADLSKRAESSYELASEGSLEFKQVYTSVVPKLFGFFDGTEDKSVPFHLDKAPYYYYWDTGFYFGIAALMLGLIGIIYGFKNRLTAFLIFISVFGFLFALGDNFVLFKIFYNLPFFGLLRIPARIMFYEVIAFSILAGFGFDYLWQTLKDKKGFKNILIASTLPLLIAILISAGVLPGALDTPEQLMDAVQGFGTVALVFGLCIFIIAILINRGMLKPLAGGTILIILTFTDLYIQGESFNSSLKNPEDSYKLDNQMKELFTPKDDNNLFRVSMRHYNPGYMAMMRNQGMMDKIMLVEGYNQLVFNHIPPPCDVKNIHDLYSVKYELAFDQNSRQFSFVERQGYFPKAWMVYNAIISTPDAVKPYMETNINIDYSNTVVLEEPVDINLSESGQKPDNKVRITNYSNNNISCEVETGESGILVFSEIWYPDWKVYVDGEEAKLLKADYSFRAVVVPKGMHTVEMKYESSKFTFGVWLSMIVMLLSIAGLVVLRKE